MGLSVGWKRSTPGGDPPLLHMGEGCGGVWNQTLLIGCGRSEPERVPGVLSLPLGLYLTAEGFYPSPHLALFSFKGVTAQLLLPFYT